jgi:tryptophan synthase alpha chain
MTQTKSIFGIEAIAAMFETTKQQNRAAFMPYFPIGYPDYDTSIEAIADMAAVGADAFEIGVPFSDPLADGPVIQAATQIALEKGITVRKCLDAVRTLRERGVSQPMMLMGYVNPILAYGIEAFVHDASEAGADGLLVPDLPPDEAGLLIAACAKTGIALVFFIAPTSNIERIKLVASKATGFIYVVALVGITGERREMAADLHTFIAELKQYTDHPLVLGFGISTPEQARSMNGLVEGFAVGSALVRAGKGGAEPVRELAASLRAALDS